MATPLYFVHMEEETEHFFRSTQIRKIEQARDFMRITTFVLYTVQRQHLQITMLNLQQGNFNMNVLIRSAFCSEPKDHSWYLGSKS